MNPITITKNYKGLKQIEDRKLDEITHLLWCKKKGLGGKTEDLDRRLKEVTRDYKKAEKEAGAALKKIVTKIRADVEKRKEKINEIWKNC